MFRNKEIGFGTVSDAQLVLSRMREVLTEFKVVTVTDLHDLVGLPTTYVDDKWGWTSLPEIIAIESNGTDWFINLPPVEALSQTNDYQVKFDMTIVAMEQVGPTNLVQIIAQNEGSLDHTPSVTFATSKENAKKLAIGDKIAIVIVKENGGS